MTADITRTVLRYYGGKAALAEWIIQHFPPHQSYLEPFCGGAAVLLRKAPAALETINDLDGDVVAFFRAMRDQSDALIRAIELTPFSREEVAAARITDDTLPDLERARRLYVRSWQTIHGAPTKQNSGWRVERHPGSNNIGAWADTTHLWQIAGRLRRVQIERRDALEVIERYGNPDCLVFADPPYVTGTRGDNWAKRGYEHELTDSQHRDLAASLHKCPGMVVLAGYASPLYHDLYGDWLAVTHTSRKQSREDATETLWLNPAAASTVTQRTLPLDLAA